MFSGSFPKNEIYVNCEIEIKKGPDYCFSFFLLFYFIKIDVVNIKKYKLIIFCRGCDDFRERKNGL